MADFDREVALRGEDASATTWEGEVPSQVAGPTRNTGARFAVWFTGGAGFAPWMHVYDVASRQTLSREVGSASCEEIAFRLRSLMSASLYSVLEDVVAVDPEPGLAELAVPPDKRPVLVGVLGRVGAPRRWVRLTTGYHVIGHPTTRLWLHGLGLEAAVIATPRLEATGDVVLGLGAPRTVTPEPDVALHFRSAQVLLGVGLRYAVATLGPVSLLPAAGLRFGISHTTVSREAAGEHVRYNASAWAGVDVRVEATDVLAFVAGARFENLFTHETFRYEGEAVYGPAQFRFTATAGVCVSL
jgi:hypothetical protein